MSDNDEEESSAKQSPEFARMLVDLKKASYKELALRMIELADIVSEHKSIASAANAEFDLIRMTIIPERFAEEDIKSLKITGIGRLGLTSDMHCNVKAAVKGDFQKWMEDNGFGDMYKPTLNASSLKALIKELGKAEDEEQQKLYEELQNYVTVHPFMRAGITKT